METYEFFARCAGGFESLCAAELKEAGIKRVRPLKGGVAFFCTLRQAYSVCLWSRVASRVLLVLARVDARDADALYEGVRSVDWAEHIGPGRTIAIYAHGVSDTLRNTQFTAVRTKDAICDQLRDARGSRPDVSPNRPDVQINVALRGDKATISLDLSGEPLHRRGYRKDGVQGMAPLKETLAASIVLESGWKALAREGGTFIDPLCGSGTLAIEAAMVASDMAPGIMRDYWGFTGWAKHDIALWDELVDEADDRFAAGLENMPRIVGSDYAADVIQIARDNAKRAGLGDCIEFVVGDVSCMGGLLNADEATGLVATNPPYGERLGSEAELPALYASLAEGLSSLKEGWMLSIITPDESIDTILGLVPFAITPLHNGPIEATLRRYAVESVDHLVVEVPCLTTGETKRIIVAEKNSDQFVARFKKVAKERRKWARKQGISCYRLYDADLPDYSVAIDMYEGAGSSAQESYLHISEYKAPAEIDEERAARRYRDVLAIAPVVLGLQPDHVFSKVRRRDKGGGQYRDARDRSFSAFTQESGYLFELDLGGYLDTGIFLDHRLTRELVGSLAGGTRFLNLFAYTGTASVYAAGGGAVQTTTVDLSQTYLAWAERNMERNGFSGLAHNFVRADVVQWISEERASANRYDLIFVDPPTFSNSKAMGPSSWSVQRDHAELLIGVSRLLASEGKAVFSCNLRSFKPDTETLERYGVKLTDITAKTIPEDFARNPRIHHCYLVERISL